MTNKISISISSTTPIWDQHKIAFERILQNGTSTEIVEAFNISENQNPIHTEIVTLFENQQDLVLAETSIAPNEKKIKLNDDHHGNDKLNVLSKKLVKSKHVLEVLSTLPYSPTVPQFIKQCYADGKVEIVLHKEDEGFGILVQTTGNNLRQTEAIADILRKKYDR